MATCPVQWRTVHEGGDPKTYQEGTTRTPGRIPKRTRPKLPTNGSLSYQTSVDCSIRNGAGAQRPHCAKGKDPRTPASWRHLLLRVVAATACAQWTDGWGSSTCVLALFVYGFHCWCWVALDNHRFQFIDKVLNFPIVLRKRRTYSVTFQSTTRPHRCSSWTS